MRSPRIVAWLGIETVRRFWPALALAAGVLSACERAPVELRVATPSSSIDREIIADLATLFAAESAVRFDLTEAELSGQQALDAIVAGDIDLALVSNALPYRDGVATVIPLFPTVLHIGSLGDREVDTIEELLTGARVFAGDEGSASRLMFERSVEQTDLPEGSFTYVADPGPDNRIDVFIVFAPIAPDRLQNVQQFTRIRLFSLGSPAQVGQGASIDATTLLNPYLRPFIIPIDTYGEATPEPVLTLAVDKMLVARRDLSQAVIYELISELLRLRPALAAQRPGLFRELSGDFDASRSTFVLHPGAQAYLERSEPTVYERYSGVAEVLVTVFIALISAIFGAMRLYKMKRKNRIDRYYSDVIAIRHQADQTGDESERSVLRSRLKQLQDRAFAELVDEKLAADESFRIFITLSNDVLSQLGRAPAAVGHSDD
jgi:TRAP-type uncharacterized transport system substrate-binding protein